MNAFLIAIDNGVTPAEVVFWVSIAALLYAYIGYPLFLAMLSVFFRRRSPAPSYQPFLTVLIAAYNEAASIRRKIEETLTLRYPADKLEVLVVSDNSTDGTDSIVSAIDDDRVRLLRIEKRAGKTNAQNVGVRSCTGEVVVFSDATATYHPDSIANLARHYADRGVGAVSGRYQYFDADGKSPTGLGSIAFWNYENLIKRFQSRISTLTGCSGCIYSVRKDVYTALPTDACSDLVEPLQVVSQGYRVVFAPDALAYEETTVSSAQEFRMRVRVATRGMRGVLSVPDLLKPWRHPWTAFQLFSHKILRWLAPVFLLSLFTSSGLLLNRPLFGLFFLAQVLFYGLALASLSFPFHRRWKVLGLPLFFCTLNAAAAVSLMELIRGHKYTTWETVRNTAGEVAGVAQEAALPAPSVIGKQR